MNSKEIKEQRNFLNCYKTLTKEQELKLEELDFREMIMCCLAYDKEEILCYYVAILKKERYFVTKKIKKDYINILKDF